MAVLSAAVCLNTGKPLLARQFRAIPRDVITAHLANFAGLLRENSQHTTIESGKVRYVYQPVESFLVVIVTNIHLNIVQDMDTLQTFLKTVSSMLRSNTGARIDASDVFLASFEILAAFDEIINQGYKENLTASQVATFLEMNLHEEKLQEIIDKNKELEATEERKRKAKEIHRRELERRANEAAGSSFTAQKPSFSAPTFANDVEDPTTAYARASVAQSKFSAGKQGLQLGKKAAASLDFKPMLRAAREEPEEAPAMDFVEGRKPQVPEVENNGILVVVTEKVSAEILRDGLVKSSEVKGDLQLRINNPDLAYAKLILGALPKRSGLQFKTHPNVDKAKFNSHIIALKDSSKLFPLNDQALGVLRWRGVGLDGDSLYLPVTFSIWASESNGLTSVTVEYELLEKLVDEQVVLENLEILIPDVGGYNASLKSEDDNIDFTILDNDTLRFVIQKISFEDPNGAIDFVVETLEEDYLFPMYVSFGLQTQKVNFGGVEVQDVLRAGEEEGESLPYDFVSNVLSDNFMIF